MGNGNGARVWLLGLGTWVGLGLGLPLRWLDWLRVDGRDGRSMGGDLTGSRTTSLFCFRSSSVHRSIATSWLATEGVRTSTSYSIVRPWHSAAMSKEWTYVLVFFLRGKTMLLCCYSLNTLFKGPHTYPDYDKHRAKGMLISD
jgi:hypothetical protein